eukprot:364125-Chlamydomonas_euryale.AAC.1
MDKHTFFYARRICCEHGRPRHSFQHAHHTLFRCYTPSKRPTHCELARPRHSFQHVELLLPVRRRHVAVAARPAVRRVIDGGSGVRRRCRKVAAAAATVAGCRLAGVGGGGCVPASMHAALHAYTLVSRQAVLHASFPSPSFCCCDECRRISAPPCLAAGLAAQASAQSGTSRACSDATWRAQGGKQAGLGCSQRQTPSSLS